MVLLLHNIFLLQVYSNIILIYFELGTVVKAHCVIILLAAPFLGTFRSVGAATHSLYSHMEPESPMQNVTYSVGCAQL